VSPALAAVSPSAAELALLAIVQGLTEFLPVSSSGHLVLAQRAMDLRAPALAIEIALHLGTLAAVLVVYRGALSELLHELRRGELRELAALAVGTVPAALVGLCLGDWIQAAFESARWAAVGLCVTAVVLVAGELARRRRGAERAPTGGHESAPTGLGAALVIGAAQAFAIWPGVSRSGSTIAAGLLCGLAPARAARFSFLLAIPAILGAAVLKLPDALAVESGLGWPLAWAALLAGLVGWAALRALLAFLGRGAFLWFALYCAVLGAGTLLLV
jgi:undecaprenyl-diphosphatase